MFIWLGLETEESLKYLNDKVSKIEDKYEFKTRNSIFPFHISLKMSFDVSDSIYLKVINDLKEVLKRHKSTTVIVKGIERNENIVWIRYLNNDSLDNMHKDICEYLKNEYGITLHEYDLDFIFHTTLFMDDDKDKITGAYELIKDEALPSEIKLSRVLFGVTKDMSLGLKIIDSLDL